MEQEPINEEAEEVKHINNMENTNETSNKSFINIDESVNKSSTDETLNNTNITEPSITSMNETTMTNHKENCIFCNIITTNDPSVILEPRSDQFVIIKDIKPVATNHFLILSHKHIQSAKELKPSKEDKTLLENMIKAAHEILINNGCDLKYARMGFHWPPFYTIAHMHLHAISPVRSMSLFNRYIAFNPSTIYIFVDVNNVKKRIGCEDGKKMDKSMVDQLQNQL